MAAKARHIDFMFLAPPYPVAGSATDIDPVEQITTLRISFLF